MTSYDYYLPLMTNVNQPGQFIHPPLAAWNANEPLPGVRTAALGAASAGALGRRNRRGSAGGEWLSQGMVDPIMVDES